MTPHGLTVTTGRPRIVVAADVRLQQAQQAIVDLERALAVAVAELRGARSAYRKAYALVELVETSFA